jgi:hypothetical protein
MKPQDPPASDERSGETPKRKEYQKPELQIYGDLAEITKAAMGTNAMDGGTHPNKHFTS